MLYTQLNSNERFLIDYLKNVKKLSINKIALELKRSKSTISREIKRNSVNEYYFNEEANKLTVKRKWHKHSMYLKKYEEYTKYFLKYYDKFYHGVKATWIKIKNLNLDIKMVSWRQTFNWIKRNRWIVNRKNRLRFQYNKVPKRSTGYFSKFNNKRVLPIWVRPKSIDIRNDFGHWEIDFIIGKKSTGFYNLLTLTERKTRLCLIRKIQSKNPMKCNSLIYKTFKECGLKVKSITIDNGIEFDKIGLVGNWLDCLIYYCEPYASYQRGSNEHMNGLIRRKWKKGTDFTPITEEEILSVENKINFMPREMFNWKSSFDQLNLEI